MTCKVPYIAAKMIFTAIYSLLVYKPILLLKFGQNKINIYILPQYRALQRATFIHICYHKFQFISNSTFKINVFSSTKMLPVVQKMLVSTSAL